MQEDLHRSDENETKDSKGPGQSDCVGADTRPKWNSDNIEPEAQNDHDRNGENDDDPRRELSLHRTTTAKLCHENEGKDQSRDGAGHAPRYRLWEKKQVQQCRNQTQSGNGESAFHIEAHKPEMPIGKLASERAPQGDYHRREAHER